MAIFRVDMEHFGVDIALFRVDMANFCLDMALLGVDMALLAWSMATLGWPPPNLDLIALSKLTRPDRTLFLMDKPRTKFTMSYALRGMPLRA